MEVNMDYVIVPVMKGTGGRGVGDKAGVAPAVPSLNCPLRIVKVSLKYLYVS